MSDVAVSGMPVVALDPADRLVALRMSDQQWVTTRADGLLSQGTRIVAPAGTTLGGHRVVYLDSARAARYASSADATAYQAIGLTIGAASSGADATIQTTGELTEPSWAFTPGPVYLASAGQLTQTPPASGTVVQIGIASTPTRMAIAPRVVATLS